MYVLLYLHWTRHGTDSFLGQLMLLGVIKPYSLSLLIALILMGVWCDSIIERQPRIKDNAGARQQEQEAKKVDEKNVFKERRDLFYLLTGAF